MEGSLLYILGLGFGLGMLHALDADHVMAISALAARKPGWRRTVSFCTAWATGHGATLLLVGAAIFVLGVGVPSEVFRVAESLVGIILIALGVWIWTDLYGRRVRLRVHKHGDIEHAHLLAEENQSEHVHRRVAEHSPVLIGVVHGLAGAAPLIALLPTLNNGHVGIALAYLAVFSFGVLLNMAIFGLCLGTCLDFLRSYGNRAIDLCRIAVGAVAVALGFLWIT